MSVCCFVVGASELHSSSSGFSSRLGRSTSPVSSTLDTCSSTFLLESYLTFFAVELICTQVHLVSRLGFPCSIFLCLLENWLLEIRIYTMSYFYFYSILRICSDNYPIMCSLYKLCLSAVGSSNSTLMSLFVPVVVLPRIPRVQPSYQWTIVLRSCSIKLEFRRALQLMISISKC